MTPDHAAFSRYITANSRRPHRATAPHTQLWLCVESESGWHFSQPPPPPPRSPSAPSWFLHACSESGGGGDTRKSCLFWVGGGGVIFDCLYLSGVNFQALSSFWACSSLSLVCSSSAFILRKNKLMAGSTMDERSWAALGCWTCFRYWIWVCRFKTKQCHRLRASPRHDADLLSLKASWTFSVFCY